MDTSIQKSNQNGIDKEDEVLYDSESAKFFETQLAKFQGIFILYFLNYQILFKEPSIYKFSYDISLL